MEKLKAHFLLEGRLTLDQAFFIVETATDIMKEEPTLLELDAPLTGMNPGRLKGLYKLTIMFW